MLEHRDAAQEYHAVLRALLSLGDQSDCAFGRPILLGIVQGATIGIASVTANAETGTKVAARVAMA